MKPFLKYVAEDLKDRYGNDLSRLMVVFPNRRASLFMNEYLVEDAGATLWAPQYSSIADLFLRMSDLRPVDAIEAVCRLYRIFCRVTERVDGKDETLDVFYGWGERMVADFDDVDKHMADARQLFSNVHALAGLESNDFLTEEQRRAVEHFFGTHPDDMDALRRAFQALWEKMYDIYSAFRTELAADGLGTEGQILRHVAERLKAGDDSVTARLQQAQTFVFVGFNVLNEVELALFRRLKKDGRALFYWDYDEYYIGGDKVAEGCVANHEAGSFLRKNLAEFPNALTDERAFRNFIPKDGGKKDIELVSSPSDNAQARCVVDWLRNEDNLDASDEKRTAVVLCNEMLLQPVLHSLPETVKAVNVTKGYPLSHTEAFTFVDKRLGELLREGAKEGRADHAAVLQQLADDITTTLYDKPAETISGPRAEVFRTLHNEAFFQTYKMVVRFHRLVTEGFLKVEDTTLRRLVKAVLKLTTVPFHGEPAEGVQVMGVLETRNLDFEHIVMLSVNEGDMPRVAQDNSFIPHFLRVAYGLTTPQHQTALFAYHFYRLLSRARKVRLVYNNATDGTRKKEPSRFISQMLVEARHLRPRHYAIASAPSVPTALPSDIKKPKNMAEQFGKMSPTALKTYFKCQRMFHYKYILRLPEPQKDDGIISANHFGSVFHGAAELIYGDFKGRQITSDDLLSLSRDDSRLNGYIRESFEQVSKDNREKNEKEVAYTDLVAGIIRAYLRKMLVNDAKIAPLRIIALERPKSYVTLRVHAGGKEHEVKIGGVIDRLDTLVRGGQEVVRVVDYKTGTMRAYNPKDDAAAIEVLFDTEKGNSQPLDVFQTFIYGLAVQEMAASHDAATADVQPFKGRGIVPALYYTREAGKDNAKVENGYLVADNFAEGDTAQRFRERLTALVEEIFDERRPFAAPTKKQQDAHCERCPYRPLCYLGEGERQA